MEMKNILKNGENDNFSISCFSFLDKNQKEITKEYILPDYLPDVAKILRVMAKIMSFSQYKNAESVSCDAKISFFTVYSTDNGIIKSVEIPAECEISIPYTNEGTCDTRVIPYIENPVCRLQNPRKLVLKCSLCADIKEKSDKSLAPQISGKISPQSEQRIQCNAREEKFLNEICVTQSGVAISEDLELDAGLPNIDEIVFINLIPFIDEARAQKDMISYKGNILTYIFYKAEDTNSENAAAYYSILKRIPVYGDVEALGVKDGYTVIPELLISSAEWRSALDSMGQRRIFEIDFTYDMNLCAMGEEIANVISDAYSPDFESQNEYEKITKRNIAKALSFNFSVNEALPISDPSYTEIKDTLSTPRILGVRRNENKLIIDGIADINVICDDKCGRYASENYSVPFKFEADATNIGESFEYDAKCMAIAAKSRKDSEKIYIDTEIFVNLLVYNTEEITVISKSIIDTNSPQRAKKGAFVIYYPMPKETLWDVGKKFGVTQDALISRNKLKNENDMRDMLIIP